MNTKYYTRTHTHAHARARAHTHIQSYKTKTKEGIGRVALCCHPQFSHFYPAKKYDNKNTLMPKERKGQCNLHCCLWA